jgi:serine/threonine protein kinase
MHEPFRSGGEGAIYEVPYYPNLVAKVYHAQRRTPERIAKLQIMVAHPPVNPTEHLNHPSIAWPTELLRDTATNQLVGFVMPRVRQMLPLSEVYNPRARRRQLPLFNYRYLVRTARNLCAAVQAVHQAGYVIGDLNESNVLVSDQALVTLVDADSFQVRDPETGVVYRSLVGKPEYTPPELQGCSFAKVDRSPEHDAFALAVLIFRLLMEGFHPFDGVYRGRGEPPELGARIRQGYFPYARGRTGIEPSPLAPPFEMLHPDLQALFVRCFEEGHRNRSVRPRVEDWLAALEGAEDALQQCGRNEQHYYWGHLAGCPWCARQQALGGRDPFPSRASVSSGQHLGVSGRQQPLPSASATTPAPTPVRAPTPPPTPTPAQASRRRYGAWVWSVLAILLIVLCVINLLPDGSVRTLSESKQGGEDDARTVLPPVRTLSESKQGGEDDARTVLPPVRTLKESKQGGEDDARTVLPPVRTLKESKQGGEDDARTLLPDGSPVRTLKRHTAPNNSHRPQHSYPPVRTLTGHTDWVNSVSFSPDGRLLASGSVDKTIKLWRVSDGALVRTLTGHTGDVLSVSFSPDGSLLASGSGYGDRTIKLWRVSDGSLVRTLKGYTSWVRSVSFSPDGRLLASGSNDKTIKLWRVADGLEVRTLTGHTGDVLSVSFSPDGRLLASGSKDGTIKLWRVADGALVRTLTGHTDWVTSVSFSPDGSLLASGGVDNTIKLWRVSDGSLVRTLTGHTDWVNSVSFSPDGRLLASGSVDKTIKLWRVSDGALVRTLTGHTGDVLSVSFSPDGSLLASGSGYGDRTIKLWRVSDGALR